MAVIIGTAVVEAVRELVASTEKQLVSRGCRAHFHMSEQKRSQFEHYLAVLPQLEDLDAHSTWVAFGDDDDLWHPRRMESYVAATAAAAAPISAVFSPVYAVNSQALPELPQHVGARIRPEHLLIKHCTPTEGTDNYWSIAVRLATWRCAGCASRMSASGESDAVSSSTP